MWPLLDPLQQVLSLFCPLFTFPCQSIISHSPELPYLVSGSSAYLLIPVGAFLSEDAILTLPFPKASEVLLALCFKAQHLSAVNGFDKHQIAPLMCRTGVSVYIKYKARTKVWLRKHSACELERSYCTQCMHFSQIEPKPDTQSKQQ